MLGLPASLLIPSFPERAVLRYATRSSRAKVPDSSVWHREPQDGCLSWLSWFSPALPLHAARRTPQVFGKS
jgi:hypothetical protein